MTHDELLTTIQDMFNNHSNKHDANIVNALYKVVELHKPTNDGMCGKCLGLSSDWVTYPCSTIQAIEKELQ